MLETIHNSWETFAFYFPLGLLGIWRWSVWGFRKIVAQRYKPTPDKSFSATLAVITPVYNEDPQIFRRALLSWQLNDPEEIIAVIDYTDETCIKIFREFARQCPQAREIITHTPGKRPALADGIRAANSEIIALVDSDTVWSDRIRRNVLQPFADPLVGGVGPRQTVLKPDTIARKLFTIHLDNRYLDEITFVAASGDAISCISGRSAFYRRTTVFPLLHELENETFWGKKCISGDDKCLTNLVQATGAKVRYQAEAMVYTPGAPDLKTFFKQQLRWRRNTWRADLKTLGSRWVWKREKMLAWHLLDRIVQPFTLLIGPIYLTLAILRGHWIIVGILLLWWHISRAIKIAPAIKKFPTFIKILSIYVVTTYYLGLIKIYALFTLNHQGWVTRWDKDRLGTLKFARKIPAYVGTVAVLGILTFTVNQFKFDTTDINSPLAHQQLNGSEENKIIFNRQKNEILASLVHQIPEPSASDPSATTKLAQVTFSTLSGKILVYGANSSITLPQIADALANTDYLEDQGQQVWILKAPLYIDTDVTLNLNGSDVKWLKLKSNSQSFAWIETIDGRININDVKITSWDTRQSLPDTNLEDGRAFIAAKGNSRMEIMDSELAYLGYDGTLSDESVQIGAYGVVWKIYRDTFGEAEVTGLAAGSKFHHNYHGLYTYGANGIKITNNDIYDNLNYGIVTHGDSNHLQITKNRIYNNNAHGIILSRRSFHNTISSNLIFGNNRSGILIGYQAKQNLVEQNIIYSNQDGISIISSYSNIIRNNQIYSNQNSGLRFELATANFIEQNQIQNNRDGLYLKNQSHSNYITDNIIKNHYHGILLENVTGNIITENFKAGDNQTNIVWYKNKNDYAIKKL